MGWGKNKNNKKVLLLDSYCSDNEQCTNDKPCVDCLGMCNCFMIDDSEIKTYHFAGTLEYLRK